MVTGPDRWTAGAAYEAFMGRWSRLAAQAFVDALGAPPGMHWLEVGCGTGALTVAIIERAGPATVLACDPSDDFLELARGRHRDPRVRFVAGRAEDPPRREGGFDVVVSGLVLNFLSDPVAALHVMGSRARAGGLIASLVWDYADGMSFLRRFWDSARAFDPAAAVLDEGVRFPLCAPPRLDAVFRAAGLGEVTTSAIVIDTSFRNFHDYWEPFEGGVGPAGTYVASLEPAARQSLAEAVARTLPRDGNGGIHLTARAWLTRGRTPGAESHQ